MMELRHRCVIYRPGMASLAGGFSRLGDAPDAGDRIGTQDMAIETAEAEIHAG